ncbi:3-alpha domain-containing protein [Candidatus Laterigemmans baculatus]|uniref:3-alpha domain-containing protein n=1 Tax=Candidatus Laterigemmans baculatus TaxID=2770505 RepID=UPI0013D95478|nr:3-alpha domain-containing protein [Candidatus Laterigemmans baculatus]
MDRPWTTGFYKEPVRGKADAAAARELAAVPLLAESWQTTLTRRAHKQTVDSRPRLTGENG